MATEFRRLIFTNGELCQAIEGYIPLAEESMPKGAVKECRVSDEFGVEVIVSIESAEDGAIRRFKLSPFFLSGALLEFCRENRIPIPREANKYLEVVGDCLAMRITLRSTSSKWEEQAGPTPPFEEM